MNQDFAAAIRRAAHLTRVGDVATATRVIKDNLAGRELSEYADTARSDPTAQTGSILRLMTSKALTAAASVMPTPSTDPLDAPAGALPRRDAIQPSRMRRPLADALRLLREGRQRGGDIGPLPGMAANGLMRTSRPPAIPNGAQFVTRSFTCAAGTRGYKLYIPASAPERPRGLVIMLHGCKQDPDDFASGTNMNAVAEAHEMMVAYPAQTGAANASACWNWFNPTDQIRGSGEPAIIAGITQEVMSEFLLGPHQAFAAGLSAGGAMAAVLRETYPDLYAAVGIHSGLAYKSASDVLSAFAAMHGEAGRSPRHNEWQAGRAPVIVFHGTADQTVDASNADRIVAAASLPRHDVQAQQGIAGGRAYTRTVFAGPDGVAIEYWLIDGAGHAWSGGLAKGSYADPQGPNASAEMMRFFLEQTANLSS